ncbi:hypothetical protein CNEO3_350006 [Clostridium neonatale]|uniref:Uncharacterized protein n=1 Tax=Clostridium neonatale TaxID=137838 RepID=A0AA86K1F6_9CLOT|nr:hypothetical protein CNEO_43677 [Clostridium neonatale]CAI3537660.1 hypothetical protein CNEO4_1170078 [Clostridium neonatale]CAI3537775.1 hypothetical protein CNEO4_130095 [Clostridium neonatale]CAI3543327.1 hypothetical protein CNEO4_1020078 [Clostridium neonatale]CAI3554460.1 hypothetical protein CNEO4_1010045 [Clostridium neonatale]
MLHIRIYILVLNLRNCYYIIIGHSIKLFKIVLKRRGIYGTSKNKNK